MFLKKRYHADIMARLHSNSDSDNSIKTDLMEDSDDSGFSSDLVIDEDFEEKIGSEKIEPEEPEMEEDKYLKMENVNERVSVIKHTCALSRGLTDEKETGKEKGKENLCDEGCCTKMNSFMEDCVYYDKKENTCFCSNLVIGDHQVLIKIFTAERKEKQQMKKDKKDDKDIRMRPFRCEEKSCRKSYFKLSHLKAHVRVHTGDRPFLCPSDSCGATFARFEDVLNKR